MKPYPAPHHYSEIAKGKAKGRCRTRPPPPNTHACFMGCCFYPRAASVDRPEFGSQSPHLPLPFLSSPRHHQAIKSVKLNRSVVWAKQPTQNATAPYCTTNPTEAQIYGVLQPPHNTHPSVKQGTEVVSPRPKFSNHTTTSSPYRLGLRTRKKKIGPTATQSITTPDHTACTAAPVCPPTDFLNVRLCQHFFLPNHYAVVITLPIAAPNHHYHPLRHLNQKEELPWPQVRPLASTPPRR